MKRKRKAEENMSRKDKAKKRRKGVVEEWCTHASSNSWSGILGEWGEMPRKGDGRGQCTE